VQNKLSFLKLSFDKQLPDERIKSLVPALYVLNLYRIVHQMYLVPLRSCRHGEQGQRFKKQCKSHKM